MLLGRNLLVALLLMQGAGCQKVETPPEKDYTFTGVLRDVNGQLLSRTVITISKVEYSDQINPLTTPYRLLARLSTDQQGGFRGSFRASIKDCSFSAFGFSVTRNDSTNMTSKDYQLVAAQSSIDCQQASASTTNIQFTLVARSN